jgi:hypothetical protein
MCQMLLKRCVNGSMIWMPDESVYTIRERWGLRRNGTENRVKATGRSTEALLKPPRKPDSAR